MNDFWCTMMNKIYTYLLIISAIIVLIWYWKRRHLYLQSYKVPGPKGWPLIGNILEFNGGPNEIFDKTTKYFKSYPNLGKCWFGPKLVYGISKPEYLQKIFTSQKAFSKEPLFQKFGQAFLGHGLLTAPVSTWKRHRKIIMPAFNQKILDGFVEAFGKQSSILIDRLDKYVDTDFDIFEKISRCTLDITCETFMGVQINAQQKESVLSHWMDRLMEIAYLRLYKIWYHFDFIFMWTQLYKEHQQLTDKFNNFTEELIREKQSTIAKGTTWSKRKAFLDLLIEYSAGEQLTVDEIRDEIKTFVLAASDTTAITACFTFVMLAMHPVVQNRVYEESLQILGTDRAVQYQDLPLFAYTNRVIKETLRLFPPGPLVAREIGEDLLLEENLVLPKGSTVILGLIYVQRNGEFWSDPLKFDPDRFLPEQAEKIYPYTYVPFSAGPRNCVGRKYAMMSLTTMIATLIRRYKFCTEYKTVDEIKLKTNMVIRPRDGFKICLELRE